MLSLLVFVLLVALMLIGVPVAAAMGFISVGFFTILGEGNALAVLPQRIYAGSTGITMLAIPFFILMGNLMNTGGITDRIFAFARACVGHWTGGLGQVNVFSSFLFAQMSGSAVADAAGLGNICVKAMVKAGFPLKFTTGVTAASSTLSPVFPPSIAMVVFASITGASVGKLFMAGIIPGILMTITLCVTVVIVSHREKFPKEPKVTFKERWHTFIKAAPSLMTAVIIIGGIWTGTFTPTEASVIATFYALILGFVYRELTFKSLLEAVKRSILQAGMTLFIIAIANFFAYYLSHQRVPNQLIMLMTTITTNHHIQMAIIILILLVIGLFVEGVAVFLIVTPIVLPLINAMGMDYVQFGIVMVLASMIGLLTPPVGMVLFAVSSVSGVDVMDVAKEVLPYLVGILLILIVAAYWPPLTLTLPGLLMN